jgi:hypothetical protein
MAYLTNYLRFSKTQLNERSLIYRNSLCYRIIWNTLFFTYFVTFENIVKCIYNKLFGFCAFGLTGNEYSNELITMANPLSSHTLELYSILE